MPRRADGGDRARRAGRSGGPGSSGRGMGCEAVRDRLDAWLEGELSAPEDGAFRTHLDGCTGCREELALARRLREALGQELPMLSCPPEVTDRVLAAVSEESAGLEVEGSGGTAGTSRRREPDRKGRRPTAPGGLLAGLADWLAGPAWRPALAAAALLLLLLAAPVLYRAVSDPDAAAPGRSEAPPVTAEQTGTPEYTAQEVARAEEEARLVLAYVAAVGREAGRTVQEEVFTQGLGRPARRVLEGLEGAGLGGAAPAAGEAADTPRREP